MSWRTYSIPRKAKSSTRAAASGPFISRTWSPGMARRRAPRRQSLRTRIEMPQKSGGASRSHFGGRLRKRKRARVRRGDGAGRGRLPRVDLAFLHAFSLAHSPLGRASLTSTAPFNTARFALAPCAPCLPRSFWLHWPAPTLSELAPSHVCLARLAEGLSPLHTSSLRICFPLRP